jgi:hypothetical protein
VSSEERQRRIRATSAHRDSIAAELQVELGIILTKLDVVTAVGATYKDPAGLPHAALDNASANSGILLPQTAGSIMTVRHALGELVASIRVLNVAQMNAGPWVSSQGGQPVPPPWAPQAGTLGENAARTRGAIAKLQAALSDEMQRQ